MRAQPSFRIRGPVALRLARPGRWPTVWTAMMLGSVVAHDGGSGALLPLMLGGALLFSGMMYHNDLFGYEADRRCHPRRPLPAGEACLGDTFLYGLGLLIAGAAVLMSTIASSAAAPGMAATALAAALAAGVLFNLWQTEAPAWVRSVNARLRRHARDHNSEKAAPLVLPPLLAVGMTAVFRGGVVLMAAAVAAPLSVAVWGVAFLAAAYQAVVTLAVFAEKKAPLSGSTEENFGKKSFLYQWLSADYRIAGFCGVDALLLLACGHGGWAVVAGLLAGLTYWADRHKLLGVVSGDRGE